MSTPRQVFLWSRNGFGNFRGKAPPLLSLPGLVVPPLPPLPPLLQLSLFVAPATATAALDNCCGWDASG